MVSQNLNGKIKNIGFCLMIFIISLVVVSIFFKLEGLFYTTFIGLVCSGDQCFGYAILDLILIVVLGIIFTIIISIKKFKGFIYCSLILFFILLILVMNDIIIDYRYDMRTLSDGVIGMKDLRNNLEIKDLSNLPEFERKQIERLQEEFKNKESYTEKYTQRLKLFKVSGDRNFDGIGVSIKPVYTTLIPPSVYHHRYDIYITLNLKK